jgi:hypothetical protein
MIMDPMKTIARLVRKYGGIDPPDKRAVMHFLKMVAPTLPRRTRQAMLDEFFFLTTGVPPDLGEARPKARTRKKGSKRPSRRR